MNLKIQNSDLTNTQVHQKNSATSNIMHLFTSHSMVPTYYTISAISSGIWWSIQLVHFLSGHFLATTKLKVWMGVYMQHILI